ncbi:MAG: T9SS type B sorting domain-containing protein, partial [Bacteroidales bacterium]|nr:T9SS type B sorting domain-containing protein [Bacteroidales bacterium]
TYYLRVTDNFNCTASDEWTLIQPTQIQYTITDSSEYNDFDISCHSLNDGFLNLEVTGSSGNYAFDWTSPDGLVTNPGQKDLNGATAGTYYLTVTDISYNCPVTWEFVLTEPDTLTINPVLSDYNNFNVRCFNGNDGGITLNPTGGVGPYLYQWSSADGNGFIEAGENQSTLSSGRFTVQLEDLNNCIAAWEIEMTEPEPILTSILPTPIACYGANTGKADLSVTGGVPGYTYQWSNGETSEDIENLFMAKYFVEVTDLNNCVVMDSVNIPESPKIDISLTVPLRYNGSMISCYGKSDGEINTLVTGGFGNYRYDWNTGQTSSGLQGVGAGQYVLIVTDDLECSAIDSIVVQDPLPLLTEIYAYNPSCYNYSDGSIVVIPTGGTVAGDYSITWNETGTSGQELDSIPAGTWHLTIRDLNNCRIDTVARIFEPDSLFIQKEIVHPDCPDILNGIIQIEVLGGTPPFDLYWTTGDYGNYLDNLREGEYVVEVIDNNQCIIHDTTLLVSTNESCLKIPTTFTPNGDGINDTWEIVNMDLYPESTMEIFNRWGDLLYQASPYYGNEWDGTFNDREMPIDSYHFVLRPGGGRKPITGNVTIIR